MTISKKMGLFTIIMCVMLVLSGVVGLTGNRILTGVITFISGPAWNAAEGSMDGTIAIKSQIISIQDMEINGVTNELVKSIKATEQAANEHLNKMLATGLFSNEQAEDLQAKLASFNQAKIAFLATIGSAGSVDKSKVLKLRDRFYREVAQLFSFLAEMEKVGDAKIKSETANITAIKKYSLISILVVGITAILVALGAYFIVVKQIVSSVKRMAELMEDIAHGEGDLTVRLPDNSKDELGQLSRSFNVFVEKLSALIRSVQSSTNNLTQSAGELASITEKSKQDISRQQMETDQVATAMNEMAATVVEVSKHASDASTAADKANESTQSGKEVISRNKESIGLLASEISHAATVIEQLKQDSENIGSVLDVIKGIAEQTNLLALNAAIEAARAGEQGRGFAVVADEVRNLASRTQESTQEIEAMIEKLQSASNNAVEAMSEGQTRAEGSVENGIKAENALNSILESVSSIADLNLMIASSSEEQSSVAEEINRNLTAITSLSNASDQAANQTSDASQNLVVLANELSEISGQFKV